MTDPSSISSVLSKPHKLKTTNFHTFFALGFNIVTADHGLINKFVIHRWNQYTALNAKGYRLRTYFSIDLKRFQAEHFHTIDSRKWKIAIKYSYKYRYQIDHNFRPSTTYTTMIMKTVNKEWNNT